MMTADGTGGESPGQPQRDAENSQGKNIDKIKQTKKQQHFLKCLKEEGRARFWDI